VIEETLKNQLEEKKKINESLEAEIVSLRKELQKKDVQQNLGNNTKILDEIINSQRPCYDKSGLGYKQIHTEKGSSSMMTEKKQNKRVMQKSSEVPSRRKNASLQRKIFR
jgi:hypothetical protein